MIKPFKGFTLLYVFIKAMLLISGLDLLPVSVQIDHLCILRQSRWLWAKKVEDIVSIVSKLFQMLSTHVVDHVVLCQAMSFSVLLRDSAVETFSGPLCGSILLRAFGLFPHTPECSRMFQNDTPLESCHQATAQTYHLDGH